MMAGVGVLALLALVFAMIDARSAHGRWEIGVVACSLAGGVLMAVWTNTQMKLVLGGYFGMKLSGGAAALVDFLMVAVIYFIACYGLASLAGGFISPIRKGDKYNNSLLRLAAFGFCGLVGIVCVGYFLVAAGKNILSGGMKDPGVTAMIAAGTVYMLTGIGGIAQWNSRRKRISREKAGIKAGKK